MHGYSVSRTCLVDEVFDVVCGSLGNFMDLMILAKSFEEIISLINISTREGRLSPDN